MLLIAEVTGFLAFVREFLKRVDGRLEGDLKGSFAGILLSFVPGSLL